jgi:hypothetical protein
MDNLTVYTHKRKESILNIAPKIEAPEIAPISNIFNITVQNITMEMTTDGKDNLLRESIEEKIKIMKEEQPLADGISTHDIHHYVLIYIILIAGATITLIFV